MSFHTDPDRWLQQSQKEHCSYCVKAEDPTRAVTLREFEISELCAHLYVPLKGTCYLIPKQHYVQLFDIDKTTLTALMTEVQTAARALKEVTGAFHINYEIHGNTVPHLHIHLLPRYLNDPFPGKPIDFHKIDPPVYQPGEFELFARQMQERLAAANSFTMP
jgi:diadenosine tetraphosphate (Ap4A) HIT family hydrolase